MTEEEQSCVARLVQEYSEIKKKIALLRECLRASGRHLEELGEQLRKNPLNVLEGGVDGAHFVIRPYGAAPSEEIPCVDLASLGAKVQRLRDAMTEKGDMESRLQQLGLGNLIAD